MGIKASAKIYKKGNVWWMIKVHRHRKVERSLATKNKREAEKRFAEILPTITDGSYFAEPKKVPTVLEVLDRYLREVSPQHRGHERNRAIHAYWRDFFGERLLMTDVTVSLLSSYKAKRLNGEIVNQKRKAGISTVRNR